MDDERPGTVRATGEAVRPRQVVIAALAVWTGLAACGCAAASPEQAACTQWAMIQPCTAGGGDIDGCIAYLTRLRTDFDGEGECRAEYDALISCWRSLTSCPPGDSICPDESTALAFCGRRP
jgi:hypothetical protein